jgi:phosphocarrier protein
MMKTVGNTLKIKGGFSIGNVRGLHTRPCMEIVKCATRFKSEVWLSYQGNRVNAKSILGILMLAAGKGAKISVEALGEDSEEVVEALLKLAANNFNIHY